MGNSYIVLGNGFSIDLVQKIEEIDLANLFSKGEHVLYPKTNNRGFLLACIGAWESRSPEPFVFAILHRERTN